MRRSLLAYLIVDFRTGTSLVELWFWTVSRWDIFALLFVIDMAGDKVIMAPIISEDPSYEGNELKKYRDLSCIS
jgi:hypothetical protein